MSEPLVFDSYNALTKDIALGLTEANLKIIKFLIRNQSCGKGILEKVTSGTDLVQLLEERCWMSAERMDYLSSLLKQTGRHDLESKVQQYISSAISKNLSNHDYYGLHGMPVNASYVETAEYQQLCQHMTTHNTVILKGPPGTWKSQHAFRFAHQFSKTRNPEEKSFIWRVDCNSGLNIYNSFSHLMNYLKIQCINSENQMEASIVTMLSCAVNVLNTGVYQNSQHLFVLLGYVSPELKLMKVILQQLTEYKNILLIATLSEYDGQSEFDSIIEIKGMTKQEAVNFLKDQSESAYELAKKLSYLPDGLVFAKTYINTAKISIESYLKRIENITVGDSGDTASKACQMLLEQTKRKMSREEIRLLDFLPYMKTDNIPIFILKSLLPSSISEDEKAILINNFLLHLSSHSLVSIAGIDDNRTIAAHSFTLMILKATKTKEERLVILESFLTFYMSYFDLDARLLEVIHRNVLLLDHAEIFLNDFKDALKMQTSEVIAMQCYLFCAIGITYRLYGNTELSAESYFKRAKDIMYKHFLGFESPSFCDNISSTGSLYEYLNGTEELQEHAEKIFKKLVEQGGKLSERFIANYIENKYRTSRSISLLCKYGDIDVNHTHNNQLPGHVVDDLRTKNLIMQTEDIAQTFLVELMIRILYNSSKNKWLIELSKDEFSSPTKGKLRRHLSSTFFPVTPESLSEHQLAHRLTQLLEQHMESLSMQRPGGITVGSVGLFSSGTQLSENLCTRNNGNVVKAVNNVTSFCPVFSPVTRRSGILYMLRSISDKDILPALLTQAVEVLSGIDVAIEGKGFIEFGVVKRIGDSSLFHRVMIERIKMECYEKLVKLDETENHNCMQEALKIAETLEKDINDMTPWKALSGVHLKIAKVFKVSKTEKNIQKAKYHYRKAYDREYESNNVRLTRFHLKAVVHYAECCLKYPVEDDLNSAKQLCIDMKNRFRLEETNIMFDEMIDEIDKSLENLRQQTDSASIDRSLANGRRVQMVCKAIQTESNIGEKAERITELKKERAELCQKLDQVENEIEQLLS